MIYNSPPPCKLAFDFGMIISKQIQLVTSQNSRIQNCQLHSSQPQDNEACNNTASLLTTIMRVKRSLPNKRCDPPTSIATKYSTSSVVARPLHAS
jgi:hypothetical protein